MDAWQRLLDGEAEEWRLLLREEFGETEMAIQDEQAELQAAWDELQSVPSYCEQQAAAFAVAPQEDSVS